MGLKLSTAGSYPWPVVGKVASTPYKFTAYFAFLDQERIDYLLVASARRAALLKRGEDDPALQGITSRAIADEVLVGWGPEVEDDDGEPEEYSPSAKDKLLRIQGVARQVAEAWGESLEGGKVGNSKAPRGIG
jgi:hypothetical protein